MGQPKIRAEPISFSRAMADTDQQRRHLLLGNGFSIGLDRKFQYETLYKVAIGLDRSLAFTFNELGVLDGDFEEALLRAADQATKDRIREGLLAAVTHVHPLRLTATQLETCGAFLASFASPGRRELRGTIFTTNYDLLLYRVILHNRSKLKCYDAFDSDGYWNVRLMHQSQVYYLHGALHIFYRPIRQLEGSTAKRIERYAKLMGELTDPLMPKIRARLKAGQLPLFVSRGSAPEKQADVRRHDYLRKVRRHFFKVSKLPNTVLFTVGHSLGEKDQHLTYAIGRSGLQAVYIGAFSPEDRARADELAGLWAKERREASFPPLKVYVFDTRECPIWEALPEQQQAA